MSDNKSSWDDDGLEYESDDAYFFDNTNKPYAQSWSAYYPIKSTSEYLRLNDDYLTKYTKDSVHQAEEDLHQVLKELNKTINLTSNSMNGDEKELYVKYSNGKVSNDLMSNVFYVSPNVLLNEDFDLIQKNDDYYNVLDALNGQALLCSFIKKDIHEFSATQYKNCKEWAVRNIFMTDLQSSASNEIYTQWPGFMSYVTQQSIMFGQSKKRILDNLEKSIEQRNINFDDIVELLCYNRLSSDKISFDIFPKSFQEKLSNASIVFNDLLNQGIKSKDKFFRASKAYNRIFDIFDPKNSNNSGAGGVAVNLDEAKAINVAPSNSDLTRAFTGDNSYNDAVQVDGNIISSTLDHLKKLREKMKSQDDDIQKKELSEEILKDKSFRLFIPPVNPETIEEYSNIVKENRKLINDIQNAFKFKNNHNAIYSHGCSYGQIDENSLHKIHFGEYERLYQNRDVVCGKKYHICIAVDQTGSMSRSINEAAKLVIIMVEALKKLVDVEFSVYGFCTNTAVDTFVYKDKKYNKIEALCEIMPNGGTAMGHHLISIVDKITMQNPLVENKMLFVITDGEPTMGCARKTPIQFTAHAVKKARDLGVHTYGIGVLNAFTDKVGKEIFGDGNFAVIDDIAGTLPILTNKIKRYLQRVS